MGLLAAGTPPLGLGPCVLPPLALTWPLAFQATRQDCSRDPADPLSPASQGGCPGALWHALHESPLAPETEREAGRNAWLYCSWPTAATTTARRSALLPGLQCSHSWPGEGGTAWSPAAAAVRLGLHLEEGRGGGAPGPRERPAVGRRGSRSCASREELVVGPLAGHRHCLEAKWGAGVSGGSCLEGGFRWRLRGGWERPTWQGWGGLRCPLPPASLDTGFCFHASGGCVLGWLRALLAGRGREGLLLAGLRLALDFLFRGRGCSFRMGVLLGSLQRKTPPTRGVLKIRGASQNPPGRQAAAGHHVSGRTSSRCPSRIPRLALARGAAKPSQPLTCRPSLSPGSSHGPARCQGAAVPGACPPLGGLEEKQRGEESSPPLVGHRE